MFEKIHIPSIDAPSGNAGTHIENYSVINGDNNSFGSIPTNAPFSSFMPNQGNSPRENKLLQKIGKQVKALNQAIEAGLAQLNPRNKIAAKESYNKLKKKINKIEKKINKTKKK